MYTAHFGLSKKPFDLSPDPEFLYMSRRHSQAYALLQYGLYEQIGFAVITGDVGAGKTTLIRKLLSETQESDNVGLISHTHPDLQTLIPTILDSFGVVAEEMPDQPEAQYRFFVDFLVDQYRRGRRSILIIDEAQNLSLSCLEQLRLLSNVNSDGNLLLQTILVGQPQLQEKLRLPELTQFAQRISVEFFLSALSRKEVVEYIDHRIKAVGGQQSVFTSEAKVLIAIASRCIPRVINSVCDMALVYAFGDGKMSVDKATVVSVIKDKEKSGILPVMSLKELRATIQKINSARRPALSPVVANQNAL